MDYTIANNARLLEELIRILGEYPDDEGAVRALEDLRAAKLNYVHRSIDHMLSCLVLTLHDLILHPPGEELREKIKGTIDQFYRDAMNTGARLSAMSGNYADSGGKLLSRDEILEEVDERRGASR